MPKEQEQDRPQPRTKQTQSVLDDRLSFAVSNKGGVSIYGLRRFPFTFYKSEIEAILDCADEIREYMASDEMKNLLADDKPSSERGLDKTETYAVNNSDLAVVDAEAARLTKLTGELMIAGKTEEALETQQKAIRYATIKSVAVNNKNKIGPQDMLEVMQLKAKK